MSKRCYLLTIFLFVTWILHASFATAQVSGRSVKMGAMLPLTGGMASWGKNQQIALEIAREEINASGGIGRVPLEIVTYDSQGDPKEAINVVKKLTQIEKVFIILGPTTTSECEVVFPLANQLKIVIVSPTSAAPGISGKNRPWPFRNSRTSDKKMDPAIKKWIDYYKIKTAVIIYDAKDALAKSEATLVYPPILIKYGIKILDNLTYVTGDIDFSAQITKINHLSPDGILIGGNPVEAANIVREARRQGMKQAFIGGGSTCTADLIRLGGKDVEGFFSGTHVWIERPDARMQKFVKNFMDKGKTILAGQKPDSGAVCIYDSVYITKEIIEKAKVTNRPDDLEKDREKIRDGWTNLTDFPGITGLTTMDKFGDGAGDNYVLMVKNGEFVTVK